MATEAIVLRTYASGDKDLVVRVLSPTLGKISLFAKSNRGGRRHGVLLEPLDRGVFDLNTRKGDLYTFRSFKPSSSSPLIRSSLNKLALATCLCETLDALLPEDSGSDDTLYPTLINALEELSQAKNLANELKIAFIFLHQTLSFSGFVDISNISPSLKNFLALLNKIEVASEKKLLSKSAVLDALKDFRNQASQAKASIDSAS